MRAQNASNQQQTDPETQALFKRAYESYLQKLVANAATKFGGNVGMIDQATMQHIRAQAQGTARMHVQNFKQKQAQAAMAQQQQQAGGGGGMQQMTPQQQMQYNQAMQARQQQMAAQAAAAQQGQQGQVNGMMQGGQQGGQANMAAMIQQQQAQHMRK
jgi:hypothetical protein